jgi:hypothetical protein
MFFGELTRWIAPAYGDGLRLSFDRNAFPAFSDDESELLERARGAYKDGLLTLNEARAMAGYDDAADGDVVRWRGNTTVHVIHRSPEKRRAANHRETAAQTGRVHGVESARHATATVGRAHGARDRRHL